MSKAPTNTNRSVKKSCIVSAKYSFPLETAVSHSSDKSDLAKKYKKMSVGQSNESEQTVSDLSNISTRLLLLCFKTRLL